MSEHGPRRKHLTQEQVDFLQLYYKTKGAEFCAIHLGMAQNTLRYKIQIWREIYGKIEFVKPKLVKRKPRRLFGGPIPKYNSCRRWGIKLERGRHQPMVSGRRIA